MKILRLILFLILASEVTIAGPLKDTTVSNLIKREPELWYANLPPPKVKTTIDSTQKKPESYEREDMGSAPEILGDLLRVFQWIFLGIFVAGIIYVIVKSNFSFDFFKKKNETLEEIITEDTRIDSSEQLERIGFEEQIKNAENQQNYRLAVRLYYLWLIYKLTQRKFIKFHVNKTNHDYVKELKNTKYSGEFSQCTRLYNFVWFGEFGLETQHYHSLKEDFNTLLNKIL